MQVAEVFAKMLGQLYAVSKLHFSICDLSKFISAILIHGAKLSLFGQR